MKCYDMTNGYQIHVCRTGPWFWLAVPSWVRVSIVGLGLFWYGILNRPLGTKNKKRNLIIYCRNVDSAFQETPLRSVVGVVQNHGGPQ